MPTGRQFVFSLTWALAGIALVLGSRGAEPKLEIGGDLAAGKRLLNEWGERPEAVQQLYEAAFRALAARRDASFADVAADPQVQRLCQEHGIVHLGGPMLGCVDAQGAKVWLRTLRPAEVAVHLTVDGIEKTFGPVRSSIQTDLTAVVPVTGLKPGTRYPYRVSVDGKWIAVPDGATIGTAPDDLKATVRIAFGTCAHRRGLGNQKQADQILSREPVAMLLGGDIAVQDRNNNLGMHRADYLLRDFFPAWQRLAASVPVYCRWDDHDYFDNDKWGIPPGFSAADRAGVRDVFCQAWVNPACGFGDERGGIFFRTRIGPCDHIAIDHRYFRKKGSMLGEEQMKWLEEQLRDCQGPFIILSCGTMWSDYVSNGKDSWGVYDRDGRERIFRFIERERIAGVLLISGDRHGARGFRIPRPSGFHFYEFEVASLGRLTGPPVRDPRWDTQLFGIAGEYAFGEFTIDAGSADPTVTFRLIHEDGRTLYELTLARSQLTPPAAG